MVAVWQRCFLVLLPNFFFGVSGQSTCGTGLDADPNDWSSWSAMADAGWSCVNCDAANMIYHWSSDNADCQSTPADTFCGYSTGSLFQLRMDLVGSGVLHLDFSSLKADNFRETKVYLNDAWQGECDEGERKTLDINFVDGDRLDIRQAHSSVVMNVHSITFSGCPDTATATQTTSRPAACCFTSSTVTDTSTSITLTSSSSTSSTSSWTTSSTSFTSSSSSSTSSSSSSTSSSSSSTSSSSSSTTSSSSTWSATSTDTSTSSFSSSWTSTSWTSTATRSMTSSSTITSITNSTTSTSTTSTSTTFTTTTITLISTSTWSETSSATSATSGTTLSSSRTSISTTSSTSSEADVVPALNVVEASVVQDFLGPLDISSLEGEGVLTSQYVDTPMGETFVAVVAGTSEAVTTAGASVKLDAELMQQLGGQPLVLSFTSLSDTAAEQFGAELAVPVSISLWSLQGSRISVSNAVVPLQIRIPTNNSEAQCVFWNETLEEWTSDGLTRVGYEDGVLICESTHLTIFSAFWQQFGIALRCSTAPALLSAEGLSAFGRFPSWLGYSSSLIVILSLFFFGLCMGSAVGSDRLAEQKVGKDELAFVVKSPAQASKCCAPVLRVSAMLGMDDTLRDLLALRDRKAVYEAFVSRCIRMLHSHKAGACWDSLRLVMIENSASQALMKSQSLLHRTKRKFHKAFSLVLCRSQKVQPMAEKEEWHESGGVRIVEGFLSGSWSSRVCSLAPAVHPWLKAVQSSLFSSHSSRTMLMYLKLVTAGAVNALFYQGSALSTKTESEECREPETPFLQAMRAFAIGIFSALVGDLLILILWKVQKRPSVLSEPWSEEVEERTLRRWKRRLRVFWCVSLGHCFFCLFYIFTFLANVTQEDSNKWLVATLVSLVEDLLMLPVTLAVSFGSVATLLLFFRPDVKADVRARWIDEDTGTISQMAVFKPSKKSVYILENQDLEAASYTTPPPMSENIRVESVGPSTSQGPFFGVSPTRPDGCEAKAVAADDLLT